VSPLPCGSQQALPRAEGGHRPWAPVPCAQGNTVRRVTRVQRVSSSGGPNPREQCCGWHCRGHCPAADGHSALQLLCGAAARMWAGFSLRLAE